MASGIPYMWPCAFHQKAKAPLAAACSKADGEMNSLSSKIEGGRVTTRAGKTTVASSRQAARGRGINVALAAPPGPTTSTSSPGATHFDRVGHRRTDAARQLI